MDKQEQIKDYAVNLFLQLEEAGVYLKQEEQQAFVNNYINREEPLEEIINSMLQGAKEISKSHDQRNLTAPTTGMENAVPQNETATLENENVRKLVLQNPKGNGFANTVMIAVSIGAILGILLAIAFLSIR